MAAFRISEKYSTAQVVIAALSEWTQGLARDVTVYICMLYLGLDTGIDEYFSEIRRTRQSLWWGKDWKIGEANLTSVTEQVEVCMELTSSSTNHASYRHVHD